MTLVAKVRMKPGWDSPKGLHAGLAEMALDIQTKATILAPRDTGALKASAKTAKTGTNEYTISFGGSRVQYAKRRHYENRKNPQTLRYLERAAYSVARSDKGKYFKGKVG